jgi:hypothetical protein
MTKVFVDAEALKRVLNYMIDDEHRDFMECKDMWEWSDEQLQDHIYISLLKLENDLLEK